MCPAKTNPRGPLGNPERLADLRVRKPFGLEQEDGPEPVGERLDRPLERDPITRPRRFDGPATCLDSDARCR